MPCPYFKKGKRFWSRDICLEPRHSTPLARRAAENLCLTKNFRECPSYLKSEAAKERHQREQKKKEAQARRRGTS